jgi:hypothetical protein
MYGIHEIHLLFFIATAGRPGFALKKPHAKGSQPG